MIITPYFTDHSAFDAYMFVVEADNKRVLHTGDFRGHGFKSKKLVQMLEYYMKDIDYIICEGSNIERPDAAAKTEQKLQNEFIDHNPQIKYSLNLIKSQNPNCKIGLYVSMMSITKVV
jgi:ribonuclease J